MDRVWVRRQTGFTIVELLIVIVIIGILAAITIVAYNGVQQRARDASRDSTVATIKNALELYAMDNNATYPNGCGSFGGCNSSTLAPYLVPKYISNLPNDPQSPSKSISYVIDSSANGYGLYIQYESKPACKTGVNVSPSNLGWWGTTTPIC